MSVFYLNSCGAQCSTVRFNGSNFTPSPVKCCAQAEFFSTADGCLMYNQSPEKNRQPHRRICWLLYAMVLYNAACVGVKFRTILK